MKKRPYRAVHVNEVKPEELVGATETRLIVAVDVAKEKMKAAFVRDDGEVLRIVAWSHPQETRTFIALVDALSAEKTEVVMEPSGTYGRPLLHHLCRTRRGYLISGKRTHDAKEVFDGVPSSHDAKSALIIARLHLDGASRPWSEPPASTRALKAAASVVRRRTDRLQESLNQLEATLAEFWPEFLSHVDLKRAAVATLLAKHPGPQAVAANASAARAHFTARGGRLSLKPEKATAIIASAATTLGVPMLEEEQEALRVLAEDIIEERRDLAQAKRQVRRLTRHSETARNLTPMTGAVTAAMVVATLGELENYPHVGALLKACGLNLRERSSGESRGRLKITKRGSGVARRYLFMLALRMIQRNAVVQAWFRKKADRDGGEKMKAVIAVMRKLLKGMWHVARGAPFDAAKLFDVNRLSLVTDERSEVSMST